MPLDSDEITGYDYCMTTTTINAPAKSLMMILKLLPVTNNTTMITEIAHDFITTIDFFVDDHLLTRDEAKAIMKMLTDIRDFDLACYALACELPAMIDQVQWAIDVI